MSKVIHIEDIPRERLDPIEHALVNGWQRGFPISPNPYGEIAESLGVDRQQVLDALVRLRDKGVLSRVGPVVAANKIGRSTLAAMAVPRDRLDEVAAMVSAFDEVNHNYEREHRLNLWFVVTASNERHLQEVLDEISERVGLPITELPLLESFHIDLGFAVPWT